MSFASAGYLLFLPVVLALHWALPSHRGRKVLLLVASYYFYAAWDWRFLGLIVVSSAIDFAAGLAMEDGAAPHKRRRALFASLVSNLGILGVFKYAGFFAASASELANAVGLELHRVELDLVLPVGISFFTFQSMSYTIDRYRGRLPVCRDALDFALFVAFFPQLVAGPIVRASEFLPQLAAPRPFRRAAFVEGVELILRGLAKKVVVADVLARVADAAFAAPAAGGAVESWAGVLAFTGQIYCDFSGYSDVAIGSAALFGYRLPENFRHPYLATSPRDFWRRWHVSLSTWLRDYLYVPLGGNRGSTRAAYRNLLVTMLLGGLWHGAAWTFVLWGAWHGALLAVHRAWRARARELPTAVARPLTFAAVLFGWVLFRAESMGDAWSVASGMLGARGLGAASVAAVSGLAVGLVPVATHVAAAVAEGGRGAFLRDVSWRAAVATGSLCGILAFWQGEQAAFLYFQF